MLPARNHRRMRLASTQFCFVHCWLELVESHPVILFTKRSKFDFNGCRDHWIDVCRCRHIPFHSETIDHAGMSGFSSSGPKSARANGYEAGPWRRRLRLPSAMLPSVWRAQFHFCVLNTSEMMAGSSEDWFHSNPLLSMVWTMHAWSRCSLCSHMELLGHHVSSMLLEFGDALLWVCIWWKTH